MKRTRVPSPPHTQSDRAKEGIFAKGAGLGGFYVVCGLSSSSIINPVNASLLPPSLPSVHTPHSSLYPQQSQPSATVITTSTSSSRTMAAPPIAPPAGADGKCMPQCQPPLSSPPHPIPFLFLPLVAHPGSLCDRLPSWKGKRCVCVCPIQHPSCHSPQTPNLSPHHPPSLLPLPYPHRRRGAPTHRHGGPNESQASAG